MSNEKINLFPRVHHRRNWTAEDDAQIRSLFAEGANLFDVAKLVGRSQEAVRTRANLLHVAVRSAPRAQLQGRQRLPMR